ncbi:MAG: TonB-dependent receptor [Verrucomicrobia bacterium]|nr:TonB-dependent receptor [Verrucomicrobiota bacterium]
MNTSPLARLARQALLILNVGLSAALLRGQAAPAVLEPFVTTATRTPATPQTVGSVVDQFSAADLARRQITSLAQALGGVPGAPLFPSGAPGASASLFLRGANSNQTLFLVDGIRFSDPNTDYQVYLGGASAGACDSLEVAHGPQSTLYGGEAVGGVVSLRAERGRGTPSARITVEAGTFGTRQGAVAAQGGEADWAYNFSAQGGHTDNARPNNAFDSFNTTLRLDRSLGARVAGGATLRWFHGRYGDPGDRYTNDPDNLAEEDNVLGTVFTDATLGDALKAHVVLGGQDRHFVSTNPTPGFPTQVTDVRNRRAVLDAQATFTGWERQRITAGVTGERNHTRNDGFGEIDKSQSLLAFFAQDEITPVDQLYLTAGFRSDDFDTFGRATTGRGTVAWLTAGRSLKFRASYGTAFRSPSFLDLYGQSAFYVGNPNLNPERARGWDAGVDYYLPAQGGTASVTWFDTDYTDLIVYDFGVFPGTVRNVERARTRGVEFSAKLALGAATELRLAYTYLEAENLNSHTRLLRRPRNSGSADVLHTFPAGFSAGAGVVAVAGRQDVDAATYLTINAEDYTVVRAYAAWQANERLAVKLRLENLLNEKYEPVNGYPATGFAAYGSVEWRF